MAATIYAFAAATIFGLALVLKAVERMEAVFEAQVITYLKLSGLWLCLLMNFNVPVLRDGIKRIVQD